MSTGHATEVYNESASLDKIAQENKYATAAFKEGLPCAIAYDTVRVGNRYGIVFELLNAVPVGKVVSAHPEQLPGLGADENSWSYKLMQNLGYFPSGACKI